MAVRLTDHSIILYVYYFPYGNREIQFENIKRVERLKVGFGTCKSWGGTFNSFGEFTWWNFQHLRQCGDRDALIIYTSDKPSFFYPAAGITPSNIDEVEQALRAAIEKNKKAS